MLFKRRDPPSWSERLRVSVWPRRSWGRSSRYVLQRLWRLHGTPHAIAIGCAAGVFISFTPFIGMHFILAALIAWSLGGSLIASALGTFVGNPLTFPVIWVTAYKLGNWVLGEIKVIKQPELARSFDDLSEGLFSSQFKTFGAAFDALWPLIKPMTIGGAPLGLVAGAVSYFLVKKAVEAYQARRQKHRELDSNTNTAKA